MAVPTREYRVVRRSHARLIAHCRLSPNQLVRIAQDSDDGIPELAHYVTAAGVQS